MLVELITATESNITNNNTIDADTNVKVERWRQLQLWMKALACPSYTKPPVSNISIKKALTSHQNMGAPWVPQYHTLWLTVYGDSGEKALLPHRVIGSGMLMAPG